MDLLDSVLNTVPVRGSSESYCKEDIVNVAKFRDEHLVLCVLLTRAMLGYDQLLSRTILVRKVCFRCPL